MSTQITEYKVFIASPSDCNHERDLIHNYIEHELNKDAYFKAEKVCFEVMRWETMPSAADRAQTIINEKIKEEANLFIIFFWHKFGSDAGEGLTGMEEEFYNAYLQINNNPYKLCFLKKEKAISPSEIDPDQHAKLTTFLKSLRKDIFYKNFKTDKKFKQEVKDFLVEFVKKVHLKDAP